MAGGTQTHPQFIRFEPVFVEHAPQGLKKLRRVAFARIDDTAVHQRECSWQQRTLVRTLEPRKTFFVIPVFDYGEAGDRHVRISLPVRTRCPRRYKDAEGRAAQRALFDLPETSPGFRIRRIAVLGHGIAKIRNPWQAGKTVEGMPDLVCGRYRIGAPYCVGTVVPDHGEAFGHRSEPPADPAVGPGSKCGVPALHGDMARRIQGECALHYGLWRQVRQLIVAHALVGPRMRAQNERLPAEPGEMASKTDRALNTTASRERWEVEGDHQKPFHDEARCALLRLPSVAASSASHSVTSMVDQKGSPVTAVARTSSPLDRHASSARRDAGESFASTAAVTSSQCTRSTTGTGSAKLAASISAANRGCRS